MPNWLQNALKWRHRDVMIHAVAMFFAIGFSLACIYLTDLVLPNFTARFDNYAFSATIPMAASPLVVYPILWLLRRVEETQAALEHMARTDVLTGVANRRGFFEASEQVLARHGDVGLMMVDIDHFKRVNDLHGHAAGDELLRRIAQMIRESVRREGGIVGRLGGEEFAVLIGGADVSKAQQLAERLCSNARALSFSHDGHRISATLSIGIAAGNSGRDLDALLRAADRAAYDSKRLGRDRWTMAAGMPVEIAREPVSQAA